MSRETKLLILTNLATPFLVFGVYQTWSSDESVALLMGKLSLLYFALGFCLVKASVLGADRTGFPFVASLTIAISSLPAGLLLFNFFYLTVISIHMTIAIVSTSLGGFLAMKRSE